MIAPEFRAALKSLSLTQRSLAERLGVENSTVNRWAQGTRPVPQYVVYVLQLLAEIGGLSPPRDPMLRARPSPAC